MEQSNDYTVSFDETTNQMEPDDVRSESQTGDPGRDPHLTATVDVEAANTEGMKIEAATSETRAS